MDSKARVEVVMPPGPSISYAKGDYIAFDCTKVRLHPSFNHIFSDLCGGSLGVVQEEYCSANPLSVLIVRPVIPQSTFSLNLVLGDPKEISNPRMTVLAEDHTLHASGHEHVLGMPSALFYVNKGINTPFCLGKMYSRVRPPGVSHHIDDIELGDVWTTINDMPEHFGVCVIGPVMLSGQHDASVSENHNVIESIVSHL